MAVRLYYWTCTANIYRNYSPDEITYIPTKTGSNLVVEGDAHSGYVTLPPLSSIPGRTGYTLLGYSQNRLDTSPTMTSGSDMWWTESGTWTHTFTVYCIWRINTFTVSYNANGGTGAPASQTKQYGTALTLSSTVPTLSQYVFDGWATSPDGAVVYQPGDSYTTDADITLYAVWHVAGSTLNSVTSPVEVGSSGTATWTNFGPNFTYKLELTCGTAPTVTVNKGAGETSATFTIPSTWLAAISGSTSGTATATLTTYDGANPLGTSTMSFTVTVASGVKPTINSFTASVFSTNATVMSWNEFVQGFTKADLSVDATAGSGATIASITFSGPGISQTGTGTTARSEILNTPGTATFTVTVIDSRGRSETDSVTVTVYSYAAPVVISIGTMRADADGTTNNSSGDYLKLTPVYSLSSVNGNNSFTAQTISYYAHGSSTPLATVSCVSGTTYGPPNNMWAINLADAYDIVVELTDALGSSVGGAVTLPSAGGIWYGRGNDRLGLGKAPAGPGLYVDWDAHFNGVVDVVPRRVSKQITSAGWFRVLAYEAGNLAEAQGAVGFVVDLTIGKDGIGSEAHKVSLFGVYGHVGFKAETSVSATQYIDKIRYTYETSSPNNGYVDIHLSSNPQSVITADFIVNTKPVYQELFVAAELEPVNNSPSGETVLSEYVLSANT